MGVFCHMQLLGTSSSFLLQQQQCPLLNASSSSSSSLVTSSCSSFTHYVDAFQLHLHNKQQLLRRRTSLSSSSSSRVCRYCREFGLGLGFVARADGERGEEEEPQEDHDHQQEQQQQQQAQNVNGRVALERLDEQIRSLSASENRPPSASSLAPTTRSSSIVKLPSPGSREEDERVAWPEFSQGFFVYIGVGLLLLTVVNNIAFRIVFGPPEKPVKKVSSTPLVRYRIRSRNEITSLDAPPIVNMP